MAGITVKVQTKKVIASLEKKLKELKAYPALYEKYLKDLEKWEKMVVNSVDVSSWQLKRKAAMGHASSTENVTMTFCIPADILAKRPEPVEQKYGIDRDIEEVENAIRILKMTDEEVVSTATFKAISKFL
jgi:hypothetical protein